MIGERKRTECGALGGIEGLAFGVLIFVFGTLMVTTAWAVIDTKLATSAGAREAARAYVEADSEPDAVAAAQNIAGQTMVGHGRVASSVYISALDGGTAFGRCNEIEVSVSSTIPRLTLPLIGGGGGTSTVTSRHTEVVDPYRSGLPGVTAC